MREKDPQKATLLKQASAGKEVWQKYNCHTCHQLYGLGGYLGPDLTNVVSKTGRSEAYLKGIIKSGVKQMPAFSLTDKEILDLLVFLKAMDETGSSNPNDYTPQWNGTFTLDYNK